MNILFIGDIVGRPGRNAIKNLLADIIKKYEIEFVIANAENAAGGNGLTKQVTYELFEYGINFITLGNHVWDKKEILEIIDDEEKMIRPANYPPGTPGRGYKLVQKNNIPIGILNIQGRVYMQPLNCPFRTADAIIAELIKHTNIIIVDFHAEATSEKVALGHYLDGKVSAVLGTHTHIQTADEKILPKGTAYITDVGMTGPYDSVLGVKKENILYRFLTHMPNRFEVATGKAQLNAVVLKINKETGMTENIQRINIYYE